MPPWAIVTQENKLLNYSSFRTANALLILSRNSRVTPEIIMCYAYWYYR